MFTQKLPGGQKKEKDNDDHVCKEIEMAIAKSAEEEAGSYRFRRGQASFMPHKNAIKHEKIR